MKMITSRRFLVRDDGMGRCSESEVTIADFIHEDAIVVLGDPGIGKTTLFKDLALGSYTKIRSFLVEPKIPPSGILFLDALDEYRNTAINQDAILDISRALVALGKPKFRVSCRAADWFGSVDQDVLAMASASGKIVVLEILPLNDEEISCLVEGLVEAPESFLTQARSAGLDPLLGNPQTLEMIARAWSGPRKPRNKFGAYKIGISELLKEPNSAHVTRVDPSDPVDLRKSAAAASSTLLLSNKDALSRTEVADSDAAAISDVPYEDRKVLENSLRRRVFSSDTEDRFELVHRTVQEFLSAEDLASRIGHGLPITRVLALMCGLDGAPVSSLRGLYAWLMCNLGDRAAAYVSRDPYAVATYGDASVLSPEVQRELWESLRALKDPWFLSGDDRGGSFRSLANQSTAHVLADILNDQSASSHLQIAALEAIGTSECDLGLMAAVRRIVLRPVDNSWLRCVAIRAFAHVVRSNAEALQDIDDALAKDPNDCAGSDVRLELLRLTFGAPGLAVRTLSVLEQLASATVPRRTSGRLYQFGTDFPPSEIDEVLRGARRVLKSADKDHYEIGTFFETILSRRLSSDIALNVGSIADGLLAIKHQDDPEKDVPRHLRLRLEQDPSLMPDLFDALVERNGESSLWIFSAYDLWQMIPPAVWPMLPSSFFLQRAEKEKDVIRAVDLFRLYVAWFPKSGATSALAEAGFDFLRGRTDLRRKLGKWNVSKVDKWRIERYRRRSKESLKRSAAKRKTVEYLTPRLAELASGLDQRALEWATGVYLGLYMDVDGGTPHERFLNVASAEIEAACIRGFVQFAERDDLPQMREVIDCWNNNRIPWRHYTLILSVYLREVSDMTVPEKVVPAGIAAVITVSGGSRAPGLEETVAKWLVRQAELMPLVVKAILTDIWLSQRGGLYGFHRLRSEKTLTLFLVDVSADVLRSPCCDDYTIQTLVPVLFSTDSQTAERIALGRLWDPCLGNAQRVIWTTALYLYNAEEYVLAWRQLDAESNDVFWEALELIAGRQSDSSRRMSAAQRADVIVTAGKRFPPANYPKSGWSGSRNAWDASSIVTKQIDNLSADLSLEANIYLDDLERNPDLLGYRAHIRHRRAQQDRQRRELNFVVPTPAEVREALLNLAPATPEDLLAYIEDHLLVLSRELTRTQRERYRAYWNESGRCLSAPKREEVCSGLLAEDLQNRIRQHALIVTVEHHMVNDKECDLVILQGTNRLLPIEAKHHYHPGLWTAWETQLQRLYARDAGAGGLGIYLVFWSGSQSGRDVAKPIKGIAKPTSPEELQSALQSLVPISDRQRLRMVVVDIAPWEGASKGRRVESQSDARAAEQSIVKRSLVDDRQPERPSTTKRRTRSVRARNDKD